MVCEPINQQHFSASYIQSFGVQLLSWFETDEKWLTKILVRKQSKVLCSFGAVRVWFDYIVASKSELNDEL